MAAKAESGFTIFIEEEDVMVQLGKLASQTPEQNKENVGVDALRLKSKSTKSRKPLSMIMFSNEAEAPQHHHTTTAPAQATHAAQPAATNPQVSCFSSIHSCSLTRQQSKGLKFR